MLRKGRSFHLLIGILFLAALLRFWALGQRELWYDEAFSVLYAEKGLFFILYGTISQVEGAAADVHPPLYYFLLNNWMVLGQSLFTVRMFSAILGIATVAVSYSLGKQLLGERSGLMAAFVVAISPFHVYYSQEARMYSLLAFLLLLGTYFFVRAARTLNTRYWIGFAVCFALAQYTHNVAVFWLVSLDAYFVLLYFRRVDVLERILDILGRHRANPNAVGATRASPVHAWLGGTIPSNGALTRLALANVGVVLMYAPWLIVLPGQVSKMQQAYWIPVPGPAELIRLVIAVTLNLPAPPVLLPLWTFFAFLLLALVIRFTVSRFRREESVRDSLALIFVLVAFPVAVAFLVSQVRPVFIERVFVASAIGYYMLVGWAVSRASLSLRTAALAVPVLALVGFSLHYQYTYDQFPRPPYRSAVHYLRANYVGDSVIIHGSKLSFFPSYYWDRSLPQHFLPDTPGSPQDTLAEPTMQVLNLFPSELEYLAEGRERVYFVVFRKALDEALSLGKPLPDLAWLEERFETESITSFNDLYVYALHRRGGGGIASQRAR